MKVQSLVYVIATEVEISGSEYENKTFKDMDYEIKTTGK